MNEQQWPWRARFAHWVLRVVSPWLELAPFDEEAAEEEYERQQQVQRSIYEEGMEDGYHRAERDRRNRSDQW